ncbi:hypothetical protein FRC11_013850 [Ceratobasidium sp. 423]|nr:hypothetical protein FRC11_013850 [Ceratobasidium sp. 423]
MLALGFVLVAGAVTGVVAAPNPTEPSGASVFNVGQACTIKWDADSTGGWKDMNIQLMTGDNLNMIHITTIAQNVDATDATKNTYSYPCPNVTPNSAIYFYQFSSPSEPTNLLWTTRWTIASADGKTTTPTETTQPNGDKIPWGKGALVDPSTAVAPPSYLTNNQANGSANTTSAAAGSSSAPVATSIAVSTSPSAAATTPATTPAAGSSSHLAGSSSHAAGSSSSTARATATGSTTGASSSNSTGSTTNANANGAMTTAASGFAMIGAFVAALGLF